MKSFLIRFGEDDTLLLDQCQELFKIKSSYHWRVGYKQSKNQAVLDALRYAIKQKIRNHHKFKPKLPGVPG